MGLIGHTGSGKSTLITHLNGLERSEPGKVIVNGVDLGGKGADLIAVRRRGSKNQIVPFIGIGKCYKKYAEFGFDMGETVMYVVVMALMFGEILES